MFTSLKICPQIIDIRTRSQSTSQMLFDKFVEWFGAEMEPRLGHRLPLHAVDRVRRRTREPAESEGIFLGGQPHVQVVPVRQVGNHPGYRA